MVLESLRKSDLLSELEVRSHAWVEDLPKEIVITGLHGFGESPRFSPPHPRNVHGDMEVVLVCGEVEKVVGAPMHVQDGSREDELVADLLGRCLHFFRHGHTRHLNNSLGLRSIRVLIAVACCGIHATHIIDCAVTGLSIVVGNTLASV